jgi:tetratricopeptide (TPR) repeat protein
VTGDHDESGAARPRTGDDHHGFAEGQLSPEQELALARHGLDAGDARRAARHVAAALAVDPTSAPALELAAGIIATATDPLALTAVDGEAPCGIAALRALTLHHLGDADDAVALLLAVIGTCPEIPFTAWLDDWLSHGLADRLDPGDLHVSIEDALRRLDGSEVADAPVPALLALVTRVRDRHGDHERLAGSHARLLRRAGLHDQAVAVARAADARSPTYFTGVILATSLRDAGYADDALAAFTDLTRRFPDEPSVHLDLGDVLLELERPADAVAEYQRVLDRDPHHEWAAPSALYARYLASADGAWRDRLEDLAEAAPAGRARQLADAVTPYLGYLPGRPETLIQLASQIIDNDTGGVVEVSLSSLEAPSAARVLTQILRSRGGSLVLHAEVPEPDPRLPRRPVAFALWHHDGALALPALPPPSATVAAAVAELAIAPYHALAWTEQAQILGAELGAATVEQLLAATVHPPPPPAGWTPWDWGFHVQVAAAMIVAFIDDGWHESARHAALTSLVHGSVDWTATAGLVALTRLACAEPERVADVEPLLESAAAHPSTPIHHVCLIEPAVQLMLQLPELSLPIKRARRARRAELEAELSDDAGGSEVDGSP